MTVGLKSCIYSFASFQELEHALLHQYKGFKSPAFLICSLVLRERKREGHVTVKKECIATGVFFLRGPLGALHPSFVILLKVFSQWVSLPLCLFCRKDFIAFGVFCLFNFFLCWVGFSTFFRVYGHLFEVWSNLRVFRSVLGPKQGFLAVFWSLGQH